MKKIISLICVLAILCTTCLTLMTVNVSAAWWSKATLNGPSYVKDDVAHIFGEEAGVVSTMSFSVSSTADKFSISFSMKVNNSKNAYFQGGTGVYRYGFYIGETSVTTFDSGVRMAIANMSDWHDYMLEVDSVNATQTLYVDEELAGSAPMHNFVGNRGLAIFGVSSVPVHLEITDFAVLAPQEYGDHLLKLTTDYTPAFRQDWNEVGGWMVEGEKYVTHYPEEGIIRLNVDRENLTYRSIERPLRPPTNYDVEWRLKCPELADDKQPGDTALELSTDNRHTWIHIQEDNVTFNNYGQDGLVPLYDGPIKSVQYNVGHDWHTWKAEVRDDIITWYVDDKVLVSYEMLKGATNRWHLCIFQQNLDTLTADVLIDWIEYTPYFEDELTMVSPRNGSEFDEGKPIDIKAQPATAVDAVEYYVNGVFAGRGEKAKGYLYTLNNLGVGTYKVSAKAGDEQTAEWSFTVKEASDAVLAVEKAKMTTAETAKLSVAAQNPADVKKAEFYANGKLIASDGAAPFEVAFAPTDAGTSSIFAQLEMKDGTLLKSQTKAVDVKYHESKAFSVGQEYEVSYSVADSGSIQINDGYFGLSMKHQGGKLVYATSDGEKTYENAGAGDYRAVVSAGYAEVYYNGHLLVTFYMPRATGKSLAKGGITNLSVDGSGAKNTLYRKEWSGEANFTDMDAPNAQIFAFEFDKTDNSEETVCYNDGRFENILYFRNDGIYAKQQFLLGSEPTEIKLSDEVKAGYYRLESGFGIMQLFCDNEFLGAYKANLTSKMPSVVRQMKNPSASTFVAVKDTKDVYYHSEDFEGKTEFAPEDYWQAIYETFRTAASDKLKTMKITDDQGNNYMNIKGKGAYILNAVDDNPNLKWRGMVTAPQGKAYVMLRRSFSDTHNKIGYDFDKGEWFFEMVTQAGAVTSVVKKADPDAFETRKWYDFELVCDGLDVILFKDGAEVFRGTLTNDNMQLIYYGRFGFGVSDGDYNFDDVEYTGGAKATAGFVYTSTGAVSGASGVSTFYKEGETVYASTVNDVIVSTDRGRTWSQVIKKANDESKIYTGQLAELPDGTLVRIDTNGKGDAKNSSYISKDGGKTWQGPYPISGQGHPGTNDRLNATLDGRVFVCLQEGTEWYGLINVFYSDDGINWTKSETTINTHNTGGVVPNEAFVVDTPRKDEVWVYARSNTGFVAYWVSKDNGKTFDLTTHNSQLMQAAVTPRIRRDKNNPDVYYAWFNQDSTAYAQSAINFPRTRPSLAVSYDGMESWHSIETVMESTKWPVSRTSDSTMSLLDGQIYWRTTNQDAQGGVFMGVQDVDKVKVSMRLPSFHERVFWGYDALDDFMVNHVVLPKTSGKAWVYGGYANVKTNADGFDAETAEKVFGVQAEQSGNTVVLKLGDGKITFTDGKNAYDINGVSVETEKAALNGGYMDAEILCGIFGKVYKETEKAHIIMHDAEAVDVYQDMIENFI